MGEGGERVNEKEFESLIPFFFFFLLDSFLSFFFFSLLTFFFLEGFKDAQFCAGWRWIRIFVQHRILEDLRIIIKKKLRRLKFNNERFKTSLLD